ncbi:RNA polymerase sigma factor RpoE [Pseudomonas amygdali pv. tabaci str. ATCC 11528]|uniref:RNA polymerase sigma factor RpoE n=6 Tax=Pseudomonas syringae group genomosp. 2 TaxID=251698 RepID=E7PJC4_PSESG|nr:MULTISPECIES: sigma-70 family RNA polymerase sigma factor [Pseudomonas]EGH24430.1 RNA polymerase sigma factor RpoE [Pseudomonas amygdali pv. mori str. 301020]KPB80057.1 RNA polymerase sigma factor sigW [Pseudomonas syringae pv. maculicola]KWT15343.1 RNA polymerase subunit sigma [Pseudomonas syringae pv. broussonetiae]EFW82036.1 RNA polymerase sigma factor RpoE [Pseudomonas savastanoi pv. glycinea str. B076]EFW86348.1 RNA polymerase sigma factor RpoE [Pseudomonas savastanoi pv. glycinea str.
MARQRDRESFMRIYDHFAPRLLRYLTGLNVPEGQAEELVQEVLLKLWHKADSFDPTKASLGTWLFRIARNLYIDSVRKDRGWVQVQNSLEQLERLEAPVDRTLDYSQRQEQQLNIAIQNLPTDQARVLRMSYFEALSHREISERLGMPLGTVKSCLRLAFQKLRSRIEES